MRNGQKLWRITKRHPDSRERGCLFLEVRAPLVQKPPLTYSEGAAARDLAAHNRGMAEAVSICVNVENNPLELIRRCVALDCAMISRWSCSPGTPAGLQLTVTGVHLLI